MAWVKTILPHDKYRLFLSLFRFPLATNELCNTIFNKLSRVFDGRNPAFNYQFLNPEYRDDWEYFRQTILSEQSIWQNDGWEHFKTEINSVLIVDMPSDITEVADPSDPLPQPYFYWLPIDAVIDYRVNKRTDIMEYIVFHQPGSKIAVIDAQSYRIFNADGNNITDFTPIIENPHDLGYCPAKFFWNDPANLREPDIKNHPLSKVFTQLDWYLFFGISKKHLDLYGSYPIYSGYEQACDFHNDETGDECDGGFLKDRKGNYRTDFDGLLCRCPKCGEKRIAGVGSFIEIPVPQSKDDPDLRNPVQMLSIDKNSLYFNVAEEERLKKNIIDSVAGTDNGAITTEAVNETQVNANYENQSSILNRIKKGFEEAQLFVDSTVCRLRYGNAFVMASINLGTEFYVFDPETLRDRYKKAKDAGASEAELDALQTQIIETECRHNPLQLQRMITLAELEPMRHLSRSEATNLYSSGLIDEDNFKIKMNFSSFVRRFERENMSVLEFGTNIPFVQKINVINEKLKQYANEIRARQTDPPTDS